MTQGGADLEARQLAMLRLCLMRGLGPVLIRRLLERFGSPTAALDACSTPALVATVQGIGPGTARALADQHAESELWARTELDLASTHRARLVLLGDASYPPLLAQLPDAPPLLYIRGSLEPAGRDRHMVAIVGSRECSAYGLEQARRFAVGLAQAGLSIVSGGARGIDGAAHHGAISVGGRTLAVLGCGLAHCYPPEHRELFARIEDAGAIISEFAISTPPSAENFPRRNRIIAGLSLATVVIEAGQRSGALITARLAAEDLGREVLALPGRVDSPTSLGTLGLIKSGGAAMATEPADVLAAIEAPSLHLAHGTHVPRFTEPADDAPAAPVLPFDPDDRSRVLAALTEPRTLDELVALTGLGPGQLRGELTLLEIQRRIAREGSRYRRTSPSRGS